MFPSFCIGTVGATITFSGANIVIFQTTPPDLAGTVGAVFNAASQLGGAISISAFIALQTSVDLRSAEKDGNGYRGCSAGWWLIFGIQIVAALCVGLLYRSHTATPRESTQKVEIEKTEID